MQRTIETFISILLWQLLARAVTASSEHNIYESLHSITTLVAAPSMLFFREVGFIYFLNKTQNENVQKIKC